MTDTPWLSRKAAAAYLGVAVATLDKWAVQGDGPCYHEPRPRFIRYRREELDAWLHQHTRLHTSDVAGPAARLLAPGNVRKPYPL